MDGAALLIHADGQVSWRLPGQATRHGGPEEAARELSGRSCRVFAPGSEILLAEVNLPTQNRQRLLQAVPFALEEQLGEDPEELHFALGRRHPETGALAVAVVSRKTLDGWLERLRQAGVQVQALLPDLLALPCRPGVWQIAIERGLARVRTGPASGFAIEPDALAPMLGLALGEAGQAGVPERIEINVFPGADGADQMPDLSGLAVDGIEIEQTRIEGDLLGLLAETGQDDDAIDLLQGPYDRREQLGRHLRPWLGVAGLAAAWLLVLAVGQVVEYRQLGRELEANRARIHEVYQSVFPGGRQQNDYTIYRSQMKRELDRLRTRGNGGDFIGLLHLAGQTLREHHVELQGGRYRDGALDLELRATDLASLDQLKQALAGHAGLEVELQNATSRDGRVEGRLRLRSRT